MCSKPEMRYMKKNLERGILEEIDSENRILIKEKTGENKKEKSGEKPEGMIRKEVRLGGVLK
jgi:hypothetical protein